jgi:hypothetical protein
VTAGSRPVGSIGRGDRGSLRHLATSLDTTHWGRPVTDKAYLAVRPRTIPEDLT